jgi:LAO/AO transport system kinase
MRRELDRVPSLLDDFRAGRPRALARAITRVENGTGEELVRALRAQTGRALTVGITGPPGVGKSTLSAALVGRLRAENQRVGVVAVDPSSPFSHGALLGDRIRHAEHFADRGVFIRSMATRGHLGGLAAATAEAVQLMDAFGQDVILIETVGVGQSEIEIAQLATTTVVVLQPGSGDEVQLLKAGIIEIADVFVVNKADHPRARNLMREIRAMLATAPARAWTPRVIATQANEGTGIDELWTAVREHDAFARSARGS